jgi:uncharacterized delta-60 repeat protein
MLRMSRAIRLASPLSLLLYQLVIPTAAFAAAGQLDPTFRGDGKVTTQITAGRDVASGVALQANGKIVAVGRAARSGGRFAMARYKPNGALDSTFGGDGKVTTDFTTGEDGANGVAIQADGKIVAGGSADDRFALARYRHNGTLDSTFGGHGKVTTEFTAGADFAAGVALQADGKIVAAGGASVFTTRARFALARYLG